MSYLVETLGRDGFLETLPEWASDPDGLIEAHEAGWREALGLAPSCDASDGAE